MQAWCELALKAFSSRLQTVIDILQCFSWLLPCQLHKKCYVVEEYRLRREKGSNKPGGKGAVLGKSKHLKYYFLFQGHFTYH